jgi:hypothetical protein
VHDHGKFTLQRVPGTTRSSIRLQKKLKIAFLLNYLPISKAPLLFGRFTGIRGMRTGENPKCTEKKTCRSATVSTSHELIWVRTRASVVRDRRLTARAKVRPKKTKFVSATHKRPVYTEKKLRLHSIDKGWNITVYTGRHSL